MALHTGCGSTYSRLPFEHDVEPTASLIAAHDQIAYRTTLHETQREGEPTVRVAIHQTGTADSESIIVFIHGVFTDSNAWRYSIPSLASDHSLWLIDTPGCGDSDLPSPGELLEGGYGPEALADRVLQAIEDKLANAPDSARLTLVAHSLGGAIAIRMLADPELASRFGAVLDRMDRAVLIAPLDVAQHKANADIIRLSTVGGLMIGAGDLVGYVREQIAANTVRGFGDTRFAVREEADKRYEILTSRARREAMQAHLLQAVPFDENFLPRWDEMERQSSIYSNLTTPTLLVWGTRDEVLPVSTGYKFRAVLPGAQRLIVVPGAKHSVQMERPRWIAAAIAAFIEGREVPEPFAED